jgi:hypothetical protein
VGGFGRAHGLLGGADGRGGGRGVGLCVGVVQDVWIIGGCEGGHVMGFGCSRARLKLSLEWTAEQGARDEVRSWTRWFVDSAGPCFFGAEASHLMTS